MECCEALTATDVPPGLGTGRFPPGHRPNRLYLGNQCDVGITITCRDGTRLRFSERRDHAPLKGDIFETADTGQRIKARIDACREENPSGWRPPFFQVTATEI